MTIMHGAGPDAPRLVAAIVIAMAWIVFCLLVVRSRRRQASVSLGDVAPLDESSLLIAYAGQTGFSDQLARQTTQSLIAAGTAVHLQPLGEIDTCGLARTKRALFVVSTTGEGDAPDSAACFVRQAMTAPADLSGLRYGLLALGDSDYDEYCAFAHALDRWLRNCGATPLFDPVEVDNGDCGALRRWQHHLGKLCGSTAMPDWTTPGYESWRLAARHLLNPGSAGGPCFHIELEPPTGISPVWEAGDIVEIGPRDKVSPDTRLPHREYSIASVPADKRIHLLVRQMRYEDGRLGVGSGWLTDALPIGGMVDLRIRRNPNFHGPADGSPLILVGNGTGLAGLRGLLKSRVAAGHRRNWLVFGERNAACDHYYRDDMLAWQAARFIERLDLAFSRDQPDRIHVQHRLLGAAGELRRWIDEGASVYVCGSLDGMAPGVDRVLRETLGNKRVENLIETGRYRRDVY
jgi:sulfite reductase (NADPH) flavoprotein alpha-component